MPLLRTAEMFSSPLLKIFLRLSQDLNNHFKNNYKSACTIKCSRVLVPAFAIHFLSSFDVNTLLQ